MPSASMIVSGSVIAQIHASPGASLLSVDVVPLFEPFFWPLSDSKVYVDAGVLGTFGDGHLVEWQRYDHPTSMANTRY